METIHGPVVAGAFYPADAGNLRAQIRHLLDQATPPATRGGRTVGLIVPHAGLIYSGPVAATAYALLEGARFERIVITGPSHFSWFEGIAALPADGWRTPLGVVRLEMPAANGLVKRTALPFAVEHSLEVQLPFLQETLPEAVVTPLLFGDVETAAAGLLLDRILGPDDLLVVSSDLSHYLERVEAEQLDAATAGAIVAIRPEALGPHAACGRIGIQTALVLASRRNWHVDLLGLATSADTAGGPDRVVGYGAFALTTSSEQISD